MKINYLCLGLVPCLGSLAQAADYLPLTLPQAGERSEFFDRGLFQFFPRVTTGMLYDDNVLLSGDDKVGDLIGFVTPGMTLVIGDTAGTLNGGVPVSGPGFTGAYGSVSAPGRGLSLSSIGLSLDYAARCDFYHQNSELNSVDHSGRANFALPLSRGQVTLEQQVQSSAEVPIDLSARIRQTIYATRLGLSHELGGFTFVTSSLDYRTSQVEQGIGNKELSGSLLMNYRFSELTSFGLGGAVGTLQPDNSGKQTFEQLRGSASYRVTELVSMDVSAGMEWRQYDASTGGDLSPVFSVGVDFAPTERTRMGLRGGRSITSSAALAGQNYASTSVGFTLSQTLATRVICSLGFNYNQLSYSEAGVSTAASGAPDDSYYSADVKVSYLLAARVGLGLFYGYRNNNSSATTGYSNNEVGFSLNWAY